MISKFYLRKMADKGRRLGFLERAMPDECEEGATGSFNTIVSLYEQ